MKYLYACFTFVFLSIVATTAGAEETGKCCQLEPGPKICGTCLKSQCGAPKGARGACRACNSTSVFKGNPQFKSCRAATHVKMCTWDLIKRDCAKWGPAPPGGAKQKKHQDRTSIGGRPVPTPPGEGGLCLKWVNKVIQTRTLPCNTQFTNTATNPGETWVKR